NDLLPDTECSLSLTQDNIISVINKPSNSQQPSSTLAIPIDFYTTSRSFDLSTVNLRLPTITIEMPCAARIKKYVHSQALQHRLTEIADNIANRNDQDILRFYTDGSYDPNKLSHDNLAILGAAWILLPTSSMEQ